MFPRLFKSVLLLLLINILVKSNQVPRNFAQYGQSISAGDTTKTNNIYELFPKNKKNIDLNNIWNKISTTTTHPVNSKKFIQLQRKRGNIFSVRSNVVSCPKGQISIKTPKGSLCRKVFNFGR
ncbi:hypothetical protein GWI33_015389 [Rhynchophorus ferrugineus]|uniref:Uncharacterized protein n=1 Tax=Rhynchophorus ferrugineus TaxID=354439 RepID=A0A834M9S8_RHYFE|nr:hypothetical protein GWI33_015389 [Rhynchophorus ferrugineus]